MIDALAYPEKRGNLPAVSLHLDHLQKLTAAAEEVVQLLLLDRRQGPWFRLHPKGKLGQHLGIDLIGFSQDTQSASKNLAPGGD